MKLPSDEEVKEPLKRKLDKLCSCPPGMVTADCPKHGEAEVS